MSYMLACDVGSQGVKIILCDDSLKVLFSSYEPYDIIYPHPGWAEQNPEDWISGLIRGLRTVVLSSGIDRKSIRILGIDCQVEGILPVDGKGRALRNSLIWMDRRALDQVERIKHLVDQDALFEITGLNNDPYHVAPKIMWMKDNEPEIFAKTAKFLTPTSYVVFRMTGEYVTDYSNASTTMLFDIRNRTWDRGLSELMEIPLDAMPALVPATTIVGRLNKEFAIDSGLDMETQVIAGCGDEHAATIGTGVTKEGLVCDITGTAEAVCAPTRTLVYDRSRLVETHCHGDPDKWFLENPGFVSGGNLRWFKDQLGQSERAVESFSGIDAYDILMKEAERVSPGSDGVIFLPMMMGALTPEWNPRAKAVFFGLTMHHKREHLVRAILEASAFGLKDIVDRMEFAGLKVDEIRIGGGGSKSQLWRQIKADVTGKRVSIVSDGNDTCFGSAILASVAIGLYQSIDEAAEDKVEVLSIQEPSSDGFEEYSRAYEKYREIYDRLRPSFDST